MRLKIASGIVFFALILTILIAGCTSTQNQSNANSINISAKAVQSPQQFSSGSFVEKPASGNEYMMYNVTFTNVNAQDREVQAGAFTVQDTSNNTYAMANFNQENLVSHAFPSAWTMTQPGTKINGVIVYDVPQGVKLVTMTYDDHSGNPGSYSHVVINLAGSLNAASGATSRTSATPSTPTSTPSGSPSSNPSLSPSPTSSPTSTPTPTPSSTPTPTPSSTPTASPTPNGGGSASFTVLFFYEPGCPYCAALESTFSFQQLQNKVPVQWIVSGQSPLTNQYGVNDRPNAHLAEKR